MIWQAGNDAESYKKSEMHMCGCLNSSRFVEHLGPFGHMAKDRSRDHMNQPAGDNIETKLKERVRSIQILEGGAQVNYLIQNQLNNCSFVQKNFIECLLCSRHSHTLFLSHTHGYIGIYQQSIIGHT